MAGLAEPKPQSDIAQTDAYHKFLYARGYLLTALPVPAPKADWMSAAIGGLHLSYDRANSFASAAATSWKLVGRGNVAEVGILGYALDIETWSDDSAALARAAARALARSETTLFDLVDRWSGRFLLVYSVHGRTRILTDACATRSAYYSFRGGGLCVASHARITADMIGTGPCPIMRKAHEDPRWKGSVGRYPGQATPFEDVWVLTPNTLIDVTERRIRRFFPRAPLASISSDHAAEALAPILSRSLEHVAGRFSSVISLTGGIDSRVTLASARRAAERIESFTYILSKSESHQVDNAIASAICAKAGIRHQTLALEPRFPPAAKAFIAAVRHGVYTRHVLEAVWAYHNSFPDKEVHLRSNLGEIGRAFYRKTRPDIAQFDAGAMADVFKPRRMSDNPGVLSMFERLYETTEFSRIENYDPYDMLYWEHRMPTWHTGIVLTTDVVFDTFILFNNRRVLATFLGPPLRDRVASTTFKKIIAILWPGLLQWDFR